jgi:hypothetical protein
VIDSHRPIHTKNSDEANGQVMVLIDSKDEAPPTDLGGSDESGTQRASSCSPQKRYHTCSHLESQCV